MPNSHAVPVLLDNEVSALKCRLAEATIALDRIEAAVVAIDKDAPAEVHALAATVLAQVLSSADHIRSKGDGFKHDWELEAYTAYEASGQSRCRGLQLCACADRKNEIILWAVAGHTSPAYAGAMPRVLLNFQHCGNARTVHLIEDDCRTGIGPKTRYYPFADLEALRTFVTRCNPEDATLAGFERSVRAWGRASEYVHLTPEQYAMLMSR
jgi:hypothetical protein